MAPVRILFDCERMKYQHTGLYHYCLQLGRSLQQHADSSREQISFYVREREKSVFGAHAHYLQQKSLHKFLLPDIRGFDIWHATYQGTMYYPYSRRIKVVLTVHDLNFIHETRRSEQKKQAELKKLQKKISRADHVVVISEFVKNDLHRYLDCPEEKVSVIYNGSNVHKQVQQQAPQNPPGSPFIFTIGTITDKKNFHCLPALLVNNDLKLVIAGIVQNTAYYEKIQAMAAEHGVQDRVLFTGAITEEEKYWYLDNCQAFVFPSLMEGFGLPVIEAMAFGKPVFLSELTSLPEIGGDAAFYFPDFDPVNMRTAFAEGMHKYNTGIITSKEIQARAAFFDWNLAAEQYLQVYRNL